MPWTGLVVCSVVLAACGGDDDAAPADAAAVAAVATTAPAAEPGDTESPPTTQGGGGDGGADPGSSLGTGSATVAFGDQLHRFAIESAADSGMPIEGRCSVLFGTLGADLPLVESNGTPVPEGSGSLTVDIDVGGDVPDFEPYVELVVPGGHWVAGASETASLTGVETPEITLTGSGTSVAGTQSMVPLVVGPGEPIDATVELTCE